MPDNKYPSCTVEIVDQTRLPGEWKIVSLSSVDEAAQVSDHLDDEAGAS